MRALFNNKQLLYFFGRALQYRRQHGLYALLKLIVNRIFFLDHFLELFIVKKIKTLKAIQHISNVQLPAQLPLVSVIIPNYNGIEVGLEKLLQSIKQQTYPHIEIVCVDSSSTDESVSVLERYGAIIKVIPKKEFRHDTTRNLCAEMAKGEFLLFTVNDACFDDPHWIELGVKTLLRFNGTSYSTPQTFDSNAEPYARFLAYCLASSAGSKAGLTIYGGSVFSQLAFSLASPILRASSIHVDDVNHLVRRDFFMKNQYRVHTCEDMDFGYRLLKSGGRFIYSSLSSVLHYHDYKNKKKYFTRVLVDLGVVNRLLYSPHHFTRHGLIDMQIKAAMLIHQAIIKQTNLLKENGIRNILLHGDQRDQIDALREDGLDLFRADRLINNHIAIGLYDRDATSLVFCDALNTAETRSLFIDTLGLKIDCNKQTVDLGAFTGFRDRFLHFAISANTVLAKRLGYTSIPIDEYTNILVLCFLNTFAAIIRTSISNVNDNISINKNYLSSLEWQ